MDYEIINGVYNLMPNETLARVMHKNLEIIGGVQYSEEDKEFAEELIKSYPDLSINPAEDAMKIDLFMVRETGTGRVNRCRGCKLVGSHSWIGSCHMGARDKCSHLAGRGSWRNLHRCEGHDGCCKNISLDRFGCIPKSRNRHQGKGRN